MTSKHFFTVVEHRPETDDEDEEDENDEAA
jgi:hypothetical protein